MTAELKRLADVSNRWMWNHAFPFWAGPGFDDVTGSFVERLDNDGRPLIEHDKRLRVQARQIYVFSKAAEWAYPGAADRVERALAFVTRHGWRADGGWVHSVDRFGNVRDDRRDLYDHAFVLFALASAAHVAGTAFVQPWIQRTLDVLDFAFADASHGGFHEATPAVLPRRSNPHMHLLEALLAVHLCGAEPSALDRATAIVRLFETRFFHPHAGALCEFFERDWTPVGGDAGDWIEPGHHFEWAWLLDRFARFGGLVDPSYAPRLTEFGERFGRLSSGLIADAVRMTGDLRDAGTRSWPQAESLKAQLVRHRLGDPSAVARMSVTHACLFRTFLDSAPVPGTWIDHFTSDGRPCVNFVPASSLYHLVCAFAELADAARP